MTFFFTKKHPVDFLDLGWTSVQPNSVAGPPDGIGALSLSAWTFIGGVVPVGVELSFLFKKSLLSPLEFLFLSIIKLLSLGPFRFLLLVNIALEAGKARLKNLARWGEFGRF